ncbi:cohesin domain-containing protein [Aneurinibacillus soli]|uniref:Cellulosome-anchoring protein n=1 Tax=Aneurinibacillus soli TaxID=1500254 RepID=A0A0U4WEC8_9BACL|nr:S-layer homology domain-containing protein [Aneurinibacillus soli]PYE62550.1 cohesin domain-containing protein [Aneurinibacillus soli]BAU27112.1 Cellulosome-anchoring protein precursor [Aneurinibacillus soli]
MKDSKIAGRRFVLRRLISMMMVLCMMFSLSSMGVVSAATATHTIEAGNVTGKIGDTVDIPVYVNPIKEIIGYTITTTYDSISLEPVEVKDEATSSIFTPDKTVNGQVKVTASTFGTDFFINKRQKVFTIRFKIKDTASLPGTTPVSLSGTVTEDVDPIEATAISGKVSLQGTATVGIGSASGQAGATVVVPVTATSALPAIGSYGMQIDFDKSALEVVSIQEDSGGDIFSSNYNNTEGWLKTAWADGTGGDSPIGAGKKLFTVTFKIKNTATAGDKALTVNTNANDVQYFSLTDTLATEMSKTLNVGKVTVTASTPPSNGGGGGGRDSSTPSNTRTSSVLVGENEKGKQAASVEITRTVTADGKKSDTVTLDSKKAAEAIAKATDNMNKVTVSIPDLKGNEAQEIVANVQKEALATMADKGFSAQVVTDKATIELPKETVSSLSKKDVYMKIEPVTKETEIQQTKTLLSVQAKDGNVIGTPLHIETNFSGRTKITLPLKGMNIPTEVKEQEAFLHSLAVFIEHSDGEKKVDKGEIQYDEKKNPIGLSIWVDKFSTFTIVGLPEKKEETKAALKDIQGHWAEARIQQLVQSGAVNGYPDGTFKPNQTITRAEFVAMVVKAFGLQPKENQGVVFTDIQNHWAKEAIKIAYANGIINGYNATTFGANDTITREQMAVILTNIKKNGTEGKQLSFKDATSISAWAQKAVSKAVEEGIVTGYPDQTFKPHKTATRAEAVTMIHNALTMK